LNPDPVRIRIRKPGFVQGWPPRGRCCPRSNFFLLLLVIFPFLDPDPDPLTDPQAWFCIGLAPARSLLPSFSGPTAPQPVAPTAPQLSAAYQLPAALPVPLDNRYPYLSFKVYISGKCYLPFSDLLPENVAKVPTVIRELQKSFHRVFADKQQVSFCK
jgi:hypothetical protein